VAQHFVVLLIFTLFWMSFASEKLENGLESTQVEWLSNLGRTVLRPYPEDFTQN
jgi:hypothetical protein